MAQWANYSDFASYPTIDVRTGAVVDRYDEFPVPHVVTQAQLYQGSWRSYYHRSQESMRHSRQNALAMRRDAWLMSLLYERYRGVLGFKWKITSDNPNDPWEQFVTSHLEQAIRKKPHLYHYLFRLLDAAWWGKSGCQVRWKFKIVNGIRTLCPCDHLHINGDKIGWTFDHQPYLLLYSAQDDQVGSEAVVFPSTENRAMLIDQKWRESIHIHTFDGEDSDFYEGEMGAGVHGIGIRERIYWLDFIRVEYKDWVERSFRRAGLGIIVITYDEANPKAKTAAENAAKKFGQDIVVLQPKPRSSMGQGVRSDIIEVHETPTAAAKILQEMWKDLEAKIERFIIAQTASSRSETAGLGTHDTGFQQETKQQLLHADALNFQDTLSGSDDWPSMLSVMKKYTFPWADFPVYWRFQLEEVDPVKRLDAATRVYNMGVPIPHEPLYEASGIRPPRLGEPTASNMPPALPGFDGQGDGDGQGEGGQGDGQAPVMGGIEPKQAPTSGGNPNTNGGFTGDRNPNSAPFAQHPSEFITFETIDDIARFVAAGGTPNQHRTGPRGGKFWVTPDGKKVYGKQRERSKSTGDPKAKDDPKPKRHLEPGTETRGKGTGVPASKPAQKPVDPLPPGQGQPGQGQPGQGQPGQEMQEQSLPLGSMGGPSNPWEAFIQLLMNTTPEQRQKIKELIDSMTMDSEVQHGVDEVPKVNNGASDARGNDKVPQR